MWSSARIYNAEICVYVPLKGEKIWIQLTYEFLVGVKNRDGHWYEHLFVSSAVVIALCLGANVFDNKMNITKWLPLLSFSIKSLLCCSLSVLLCHLRLLGDERGKKKLRVYVRNAIHTKRRPKCEFPAFCEAVRVAAGDRRQHRPKKIMRVFFLPPWFLLSKGTEPFSQKHKRCAVREANGSICPDSRLFFSLFSIFSIVARRKSFKWHLTLLRAAEMAYSS